MEAKFINKPSGAVPTAALGNLYVETDMTLIYVRLKDATGAVLLDEPYYPASGLLTLYDPAQLIEQRMRDRAESYSLFTAEAYYKGRYHDDHEQTEVDVDLTFDSMTFGAIYCETYAEGLVTAGYLAKNFLTAAQTRVLPPEADITLSYFAVAGERADIAVYAVVENPDGSHERLTDYDSQNLVGRTGCYTLPLNIPQTEADYAARGQRLLMLTAECGDRSFTVYIDRRDGGRGRETFLFRNSFNAPDTVAIPAISTDKTEVKVSDAAFSGKLVQYDRSVTRTRTVESLPMSQAEMRVADELFSSHCVSRLPRGLEALITESTCDISDTDEKPGTVKFTWRYADNRPRLRTEPEAETFALPYTPAFD